ncbi:hypothetical protein KAK11_17225 [Ideonella paludis]|uniref:Uncharacterized protein n=1 Tax=Ideonella paludis TaxID=1233411 RepID=A0ABS5E106_9BURK|nr:hypothetical protein [Ideonella paludis]
MLGTRTEPATAASSSVPATLTWFELTPAAASGPAASAPQALQPTAAEPALSAAAPHWLLEASRKPPCSAAPEPPMLSGSAAEAAEQASWELVVARLLGSPNTDMRAAGLYVTDQAEALVREAQGSQSPLVMEWAWLACQKHSTLAQPAACASLTAQQLLDAGAGDPHSLLMALLDEAVAARQADRVDELLLRLAAVQPKAQAVDRIPAMTVALWSEPLSNTTRAAVMGHATGVWAAAVLPPYQRLSLVCHPEVLATRPSRRQACEGLARTMSERGQHLLQVSLGLRLGETLGWPLEEIRAKRLAADAGVQSWSRAQLGHFKRGGAEFDACGFVKEQVQHAMALAERGERWFLAQQLLASGRDVAAWSAEIKPYEPRPVPPAPSDPL